MKRPNGTGGIPPPDITGNHTIPLEVSPELLERMKARATADKFDLHEWLLRTVIVELLRPEAELVAARRARASVAALQPPPSLHTTTQPGTERTPHAAHS